MPIRPKPPLPILRSRLACKRMRLSSLEGISVLVVDDDDESREVVAAYLQDHCAAVLTAASAAQAFDLLQRERVDVLLADVAMPGEDGYMLIRKLRARTVDQMRLVSVLCRLQEYATPVTQPS